MLTEKNGAIIAPDAKLLCINWMVWVHLWNSKYFLNVLYCILSYLTPCFIGYVACICTHFLPHYLELHW